MARMRLAELKIKIKSLAAEMAWIHHDERKARRSRDSARARRRALDGEHLSHRAIRAAVGPPPPTVIEDRDAVFPVWGFVAWDWPGALRGTREQHVAAEAHHDDVRESLHWHRHGLKAEMRATLIAYAYLRGRPYRRVEPGSRTSPDWDRVERIADRFGGAKRSRTELDAWAQAPAPPDVRGLDVAIRRLSETITAR